MACLKTSSVLGFLYCWFLTFIPNSMQTGIRHHFLFLSEAYCGEERGSIKTKYMTVRLQVSKSSRPKKSIEIIALQCIIWHQIIQFTSPHYFQWPIVYIFWNFIIFSEPSYLLQSFALYHLKLWSQISTYTFKFCVLLFTKSKVGKSSYNCVTWVIICVSKTGCKIH